MKPYFLSLLILFPFYSYTQGCSDAGFCTINAINPTSNIDTIASTSNYFKTGVSFGSSQYNVSVFNSYLEYDYNVSQKVMFSTNNYTIWFFRFVCFD